MVKRDDRLKGQTRVDRYGGLQVCKSALRTSGATPFWQLSRNNGDPSLLTTPQRSLAYGSKPCRTHGRLSELPVFPPPVVFEKEKKNRRAARIISTKWACRGPSATQRQRIPPSDHSALLLCHRTLVISQMRLSTSQLPKIGTSLILSQRRSKLL